MSNFTDRCKNRSNLWQDELTWEENKKIKQIHTRVKRQAQRKTAYCVRNELLKKILEQEEKIDELHLIIHELKLMLAEYQDN